MLVALGIAAITVALPRAAAAQPVIDGVVDAAYGQPLATDGLGDYVGFPEWDLDKLYVTHDSTYLYVAFTMSGDIITNDQAKYLLYIDTTNDGTGASTDPWTRNVTVSGVHKPEYSINTWLDQLPYGPDRTEIWNWTGSSWQNVGKAAAAARAKNSTGSVVEYKVALSALGNPSKIWIEVFSSGKNAGDNAQDTINAPANDFNAPSGGGQWSTQSTLSCSTLYTLVTTSPDATVDTVSADATVDSGSSGDATVDVTVDGGTPTGDATIDATVDSATGGDSNAARDARAVDDAFIRSDHGVTSDGTRDGGVPPDSGLPPRGNTDEGCGCGAKAAVTQGASAFAPLLLLLLWERRRRRR